MFRLILPFLDMLRFRSGPQDLPASRGFMVLLAALYLAGGFLAGAVLGEPDYGQRSLLAIGVQFGVITALLSAKGFGARIEQTLSAISGTGVLFGLASIYLLSLIDPERPQAELAAVYLLLFFWSLAVDGHIYRRALSSKMGLGVLVAVSIFALNFILLKALFG